MILRFISQALSFAELWFTLRIIEVIRFESWYARSTEKPVLGISDLPFPTVLTLADEMELRLHYTLGFFLFPCLGSNQVLKAEFLAKLYFSFLKKRICMLVIDSQRPDILGSTVIFLLIMLGLEGKKGAL